MNISLLKQKQNFAIPTAMPNTQNRDEILYYFCKYIWWQTPDDAIKWTDRLVAQAMCYAQMDEYKLLWQIKDDMIHAIQNAQAGWFDKKSWHFWHLMLDLVKIDEKMPPLPKRTFH